MNRRRSSNTQRTSAINAVAVVLAAVITAFGGVLHAYYKNLQIQTSRRTDAVQKNIGKYRTDIRTMEMRMDQQLNLFAIRQRLDESHTRLQPIPLSAVEEVSLTTPAPPSVATRTP